MTRNEQRPAPQSDADRELLKLAAAAAELQVKFDVQRGYSEYGNVYGWNPLADDGDAIRLATKLGLAVSMDPTGVRVQIDGYDVTDHANGDPAAALRRGIVKAAAYVAEQAE